MIYSQSYPIRKLQGLTHHYGMQVRSVKQGCIYEDQDKNLKKHYYKPDTHQLSSIYYKISEVLFEKNKSLVDYLTAFSDSDEPLVIVDSFQEWDFSITSLHSLGAIAPRYQFGITYVDAAGRHTNAETSYYSHATRKTETLFTPTNYDVVLNDVFSKRFHEREDIDYLNNDFLKKAGIYIQINTSIHNNYYDYNNKYFTKELDSFLKKTSIQPMDFTLIKKEKAAKRLQKEERKKEIEVEKHKKNVVQENQKAELQELLKTDPLGIRGISAEAMYDLLTLENLFIGDETNEIEKLEEWKDSKESKTSKAFKTFYKDISNDYPAIPHPLLRLKN